MPGRERKGRLTPAADGKEGSESAEREWMRARICGPRIWCGVEAGESGGACCGGGEGGGGRRWVERVIRRARQRAACQEVGVTAVKEVIVLFCLVFVGVLRNWIGGAGEEVRVV